MCPVKALGLWYVHITSNKYKQDTFLSSYYIGKEKYDATDADIRSNLKAATVVLNYPEMKGISIGRINTHSLRGSGANALSLSGYSNREIQKMGRWKSDTFKEYISDQLSDFSEGMSKSMKKVFNFVNTKGGVYSDTTLTMVNAPYAPPSRAA